MDSGTTYSNTTLSDILDYVMPVPKSSITLYYVRQYYNARYANILQGGHS